MADTLKVRNSIVKTPSLHKKMTLISGKHEFKAWLDSDISLSSQASFGDLNDNIPSNTTALLVSNFIFNSPPTFSMRRGYLYSGHSPIDITLKCILKCTKDFDQDIKQPLLELYKICLPKKGEKVHQSIERRADWFDKEAANSTGARKSGLSALGFAFESINNMINAFEFVGNLTPPGRKVVRMLEDVSFLTTPTMVDQPVNVYIGAENQQAATVFLQDYLISSISITLGPLILSPGLPEVVNVELHLIAGVTTSDDVFTTLFAPPVRRGATGPSSRTNQ